MKQRELELAQLARGRARIQTQVCTGPTPKPFSCTAPPLTWQKAPVACPPVRSAPPRPYPLPVLWNS